MWTRDRRSVAFSFIAPWRGVILVALVTILFAVASVANAQGDKKLEVTVGIPPLAYFVEQIGGDCVSVTTMLAPGHSPETYEPTPKDLAALEKTDVYFEVGVPFEEHLARAIRSSFAKLKVVDLSTAVPEVYHQEESEEAYVHSPHYWLSPRLMNIVADTIYANLASLLPEGKQQFDENLHALKAELSRVDSLIGVELQAHRSREFWVFHPAYDYFADSYGLTQVALEHEGKEPGSRQLAELMERAKSDGVKVIYVQPQFSSGTARALAAEIDAHLQPLDPLAHDYIDNLLYIAKQLAAGFSER